MHSSRWRRDVDLHERSNGCRLRAVARFTERADGGDQDDYAVSSQQIRDERDPARYSYRGRASRIRARRRGASSDDVTVQDFDSPPNVF